MDHSPHARPGPVRVRVRVARAPRPADTNVTLFKGFLSLLHFENYFFCHFNNCFCESGWFYDNHQLDWGQKGAGMGGSYRLISPYPTDLYKLPVEFSYIEETTKFADAPADELSIYWVKEKKKYDSSFLLLLPFPLFLRGHQTWTGSWWVTVAFREQSL